MKTIEHTHEFTVIGGGLAGICAAVTAARQGIHTALVQDRPVLGGNASTEIRVPPVGASQCNFAYSRETGLIEELFLNNLHRNPTWCPEGWNLELETLVRNEPKLELFLNAAVCEVTMSGTGDRVAGLRAYCSIEETWHQFAAPYFADCSGDGVVASLAGAAFRQGVEARSEFNEPMCPDEPSSDTSLPGVNITHICDVDSRAIDKCIKKLKNEKPKGEADFRKVLENKDLDAVVIATPHHWHAPMTMLAMDAGKHVYVEKPCSHNPAEGEMLIKKQKATGKVFQMGNQRRSSTGIMEAKALIEAGEIGELKKAECWYGRKRGPIGTGKVVAVPDWLNWDLWQGPAPRTDFRDNIVHYNWHWFLRWGTGEVCNNGTHEIDVCRWLLGVDYATKIVSKAGKEVITTGDWEFFDHQVTDFTFANGLTIQWEGYSHKAFKKHGKGRRALITGSKGEMVVTEGGYEILGRDKKKIDTKGLAKDATDTTAPTKELTGRHCWNFIEAVRGNGKTNSPVDEAHQSVLLCHLGNIAQFAGGSIDCDPKTGKIVGNDKAMKMWGRDYEKGWEPKV